MKIGGTVYSLILNIYQGNHAEARRIAEEFWANDKKSLNGRLIAAAIIGDRARANEFAARIDKYPGSARQLLYTLSACWLLGRHGLAKGCRNGVPFDLEATPNFKSRIEESGLVWPPEAFRDISTEDSQ